MPSDTRTWLRWRAENSRGCEEVPSIEYVATGTLSGPFWGHFWIIFAELAKKRLQKTLWECLWGLPSGLEQPLESACEAQGGPRAAQAAPGGSSGNPSRELRGAPGRKVAKTVIVLHGLEGPKGASEDGGAKMLKNHWFFGGVAETKWPKL